MRNLVLTCTTLLLGAGCSSESTSIPRDNAVGAPPCVAGDAKACACATGDGTQSCTPAGTWSACQCTAAPPVDIGNPDPVTPVVDGGSLVESMDERKCSPGFYFGTYDCELTIFGLPVPLAGDVSFNLSINETTIDGECEPGVEFCSDLVISENGGTLFGIGAGFYGFETMLQGALDCTTGEFRAMGVDGRWGTAVSTDPNDPDALWTVEDPPLGVFDGMLMGTHTSGGSETIAGDWDLIDSAQGLRCAGPFSVTLQP